MPADFIPASNGHPDHDAVEFITSRSDDCQVTYNTDVPVDGEYKTYDLGFATVEAVQAGNNQNHDINTCVGWLVTLQGGISIQSSGKGKDI